MEINNLDDLLNKYEDKEKQEKEKNKQIIKDMNDKRKAFENSFNEIYGNVIYPTFQKIFQKFKEHGNEITTLDKGEERYTVCIQKNYLIKLKGSKKYFKITIAGNPYHEKVFILLHYNILNKVEEKESIYELSDITPELLNAIIINGFRKFVE